MIDRPPVYTPLVRRFGSERDREFRETEELYRRVKARQDRFDEDEVSIGKRIYAELPELPETVDEALVYAMYDLLHEEPYLGELPPPDLARMSMDEFVAYRNMLLQREYFFANQAELLKLIHLGLMATVGEIAAALPETAEPTPFTIPLVHALPDPALLIEGLFATLATDELQKRGLFKPVADRLYRNILEASGRPNHKAGEGRPLKHAASSGLPPDELVETYLAGTPFYDLFKTPIPLKLTHEDRFGHTHILGGTGAGKTTLLENLILHDLRSPDPPSLVVIDPHGDLIKNLSSADLGIEDRLIIIDPRDIEYPVALNPLAVNRERLQTYDEATREQVTAGVIQTFGYLWNGLTNLTLTGKQDVFFRYVTRLLLTFPGTMGRNATILDMLEIMRPRRKDEPNPFADAIAKLPPIVREFFETDFDTKTFEGTREQIRYRIQALIENPTMARLFTSPETKVDFFTEMNNGAVILVDTAKDFLKEGSAVFGKLMISLILQAVLERAAIAAKDRKPAFLIVDEAGSYFSTNIDDLLTEARKYKTGLVLSHQFLDQTTGSLRASLAANTAIKFAGGLSAGDARSIAADMRTDAEFILNQPRYHFAAHIRNVTPQAVSIPIEPIRNLRPLKEIDYRMLLLRNRLRVSADPPQADGSQPPAPPPEPDEDFSREW